MPVGRREDVTYERCNVDKACQDGPLGDAGLPGHVVPNHCWFENALIASMEVGLIPLDV